MLVVKQLADDEQATQLGEWPEQLKGAYRIYEVWVRDHC